VKVLIERKDTKKRSQEWSRAVFQTYGRVCWLHLRENPKSKVPAVDAAHVIKRSRMGAALAYGPKNAPVEPRLGRPLCREHHQAQELGLDVGDRFSFVDVLEATLAHNEYAKCKLPEPDLHDHP